MILVVLVVIILFLLYKCYGQDNLKSIPQRGMYSQCSQSRQHPSLEEQTRSEQKFFRQVADIENTTDAHDYNEYMVATGLDPSVLDSHADFTDDIQNTTVGASAETVRSDSEDIVPMWGLRRTNAYIPINPNSRDVPSQTDDTMQKNGTPGALRYGLF
jgi:hypothetical protein